MTESSLVRRLAGVPRLFDALRWMLEGGYRGHHGVVARHLNNVGRVLDLGCGTGIYAPFFPPDSYVGADLSEAYIAAAQAKFPGHRFVVQDGTRTSFQEAEFDACMISGVLHHLDDSQAAQLLEEASRVVRPGGTIVVWEDIPSRWWNGVGHVIHRLDLGNHIRSPEGYRQLLQRHFTIVCSEHMRSGAMDYQVFQAKRPAAL
ncbi:23S rRNA (guanine(745)-N(1))-methyltransferase [Caulifigura coniformis]|uniref:23S rRNA (Guanine(745)-N(1))-methyltransferase n=1 Tax=Caulifigura coniformis TaxID=2527983 RepID=A0A517SKN0_9PLAN|nr:class I SAM-dependent methyltransferase [Caulifigura coniformis]QDT56683.1 23S rRNA (guanine(745)-N(1))-methyltransferase [Caulifigura coniformis]